MTEQIRVKALDIGEGHPVLIEWLGDIVGDEDRYIRVSVSRMKGPFLGLLRPVEALTSVQVPIGLLRLLRVGDVWEDGIRVRSFSKATEHQFKDLRVDSETTALQGSGSRLDHQSQAYLLPYGQFDAHVHHTSSQLLKVKVDETTSLLIPCIELIRFYFGASGSLIKQLFSGKFALEPLLQGSWIRDGNANVILPPGWHSNAVQHIARVCFDHAAKAAVGRLIQSGVAAHIDQKPWYPKMGFPFSGPTDLTAQGEWIKHKDQHLFLALRLIRCSHPFPFEKVFYKSARSAADRDAPSKIRIPIQNHSSRRALRPARTVTSQRVMEGPRVSVTLPESDADPFPDLAYKNAIHAGERIVIGTSKQHDQMPKLLTAGGVAGLAARGMELVAKQIVGLDPEAAPDALCALDFALLDVRTDVSVVKFEDGHSFARIWIEESFEGLFSQRWVWCRLLRLHPEVASADTLMLVCAEDRFAKETPELLAFLVASSEPYECLGLMEAFLKDWGWRVGTSCGLRVRCVLALSYEEIDQAVDTESLSQLVSFLASQLPEATEGLDV